MRLEDLGLIGNGQCSALRLELPARMRRGRDGRVMARRAGGEFDAFPFAHSHIGLIRAAFASAPRWSELL